MVPLMRALGDWGIELVSKAGIVAASSLAMVTGLLAMIAGRPIDIEAARGDDGYRRTVAVEVSRLEPHFVTGERHPERPKIFTAATKTKSDRLEKATIVQKLVPTRPETFLTFSPALVEEMLRGAPRQFNPRLDAAAVRASRAPIGWTAAGAFDAVTESPVGPDD